MKTYENITCVPHAASRGVHACAAASPNHIHILYTSNSCEVGVHSARSAVERSNSNNNMALAATHHRDAVLHTRAKIHENVNMKYRYTLIPEYTYTCDTHAHTLCEEGAAGAAGAAA